MKTLYAQVEKGKITLQEKELAKPEKGEVLLKAEYSTMSPGFVGAITAQVARAAGALPVIVTDLDEGRLDIARKMGVHHAINPKTHPDEIRKLISTGVNTPCNSA